MADDETIEFELPLHGVDEAWARQAQPRKTTPDALNVIPYDRTGRARLGSRPGLKNAYGPLEGTTGTTRAYRPLWVCGFDIKNGRYINTADAVWVDGRFTIYISSLGRCHYVLQSDPPLMNVAPETIVGHLEWTVVPDCSDELCDVGTTTTTTTGTTTTTTTGTTTTTTGTTTTTTGTTTTGTTTTTTTGTTTTGTTTTGTTGTTTTGTTTTGTTTTDTTTTSTDSTDTTSTGSNPCNTQGAPSALILTIAGFVESDDCTDYNGTVLLFNAADPQVWEGGNVVEWTLSCIEGAWVLESGDLALILTGGGGGNDPTGSYHLVNPPETDPCGLLTATFVIS